MGHITQPKSLGIWSTPWLLWLVMSNISKMGQLPTPDISGNINLPSGNLTVSHGKSPLLIGKPSINGPFSMAMLNNQMVSGNINLPLSMSIHFVGVSPVVLWRFRCRAWKKRRRSSMRPRPPKICAVKFGSLGPTLGMHRRPSVKVRFCHWKIGNSMDLYGFIWIIYGFIWIIY